MQQIHSFISLEKGLLPLFRKKIFFMSYWQILQNSQLATLNTREDTRTSLYNQVENCPTLMQSILI